MKSIMKKAAVVASTIGALSVSYIGGKKIEQNKGEVQKIQEQLGSKKRWVAYSKKDFLKNEKSFQSQKNLSAMGGAPIKGQLQHLNGFIFDASDAEIKEMKKKVGALSDDWVITEDRVYKTQFLSGCTPTQPGPEPPPIDPTPTPAQIPWGVDKVNAIAAQAQVDSSNVVVCIVDTGIDMDHPDLSNMIIGGSSHVPNTSSFDDDEGHGTHVAGTVAAEANDRDVIGVSQAKLYGAKVLDSYGSGYGSWIANGIVACVNAGAKVINMSLGSPASGGPDPLITDAVDFATGKGVITVCAAGNDGGPVGYPAKNCTYAVSATDRNDQLAYFSSRGPEIDFAAPGVSVLSTKNGGGVETLSGTSMASPHVAGAMALAIAAGRSQLKGDDINLPADHQGKGRVNAVKSLQ